MSAGFAVFRKPGDISAGRPPIQPQKSQARSNADSILQSNGSNNNNFVNPAGSQDNLALPNNNPNAPFRGETFGENSVDPRGSVLTGPQ